VGCGLAVTLFELARRRPQSEFHGFDHSRFVLRYKRERARNEGLHNLHFEYGRLPGLDVERQFDLVTCIATLHYVREARRALRGLYMSVRPGGYLIFNYSNERQRGSYQADSGRDPSVRRRFALVLSGTNLLSRAVIERTLHHRPESFWRNVGEPVPWNSPCVVMSK
jgi:ubiquinone/menaquinone biosynthesis C-methylase UbiE